MVVELGTVVTAPGTVTLVGVMPSDPAAPGGPGGAVVVVVVGVPCRSTDVGGNWMGFRKMMMQAIATKHPPANASNLRLRSVEPSRAARKKPLSRKNRAMLTELLTP